MRRATIERNTSETKIKLSLALDGKGRYDVSTGIRFLDHMLELLSRHGLFDLKIKAVGDLDVDQHHTVEDVGPVLDPLSAGPLADDAASLQLDDPALEEPVVTDPGLADEWAQPVVDTEPGDDAGPGFDMFS